MAIVASKAMWAAVAFLIIYVLRALFRRNRLAGIARQSRCLPIARYKHKDPVFGLDLLKTQLQAMQHGDTIGPEMERFHYCGRTYDTLSWGTVMVYTMDWRVIQAISTVCFDHFGVSDMRYPASMPLLGSNIFTTDGAPWEHYRNTVKPIFAKAQAQDIPPFAKHVDHMIESLPRDGSTVDLQHHFKILMLRSSMEFIFGPDAVPSADSPQRSDGYELTQAFDRAMKGIHKRWFFGASRFLLGPQGSYKKDCQRVHEIVDKFIERAFANSHEKPGSGNDPTKRKIVLLDEMVKEYGRPSPEIRDQLLGIFFPARDTSAITLSNIFWFLARHRQVWQRLRNEVLAIDQPLTFEYLKSLKYLHSVISETLRLVLPAQTGVVKANKDTVLPAGGGPDGSHPLLIPAATYITFNWRAMHRDQDFWGPDAEAFRPERWAEMARPPHWEFVPFNGGRRMCPAQQMVLTEIAYAVVRMLQAFEGIENRDPVREYVEGFNFTMESKRGVEVGLVCSP